MVNTRKNVGAGVLKKNDGKMKRIREDVVFEPSKKVNKGVVKSDLRGKKSVKLVKENKELVVADSDFEDTANKDGIEEAEVAVKLSSANIIPRHKLIKHINISLYYFRKLARHSSNIKIRVTTTDCWFHVKLSALYGQYGDNNADTSLLTGDCDVAQYIRGFSMDVNTPWVDVDFVMFPIHMTDPDHWFLLIFDVHRRVLVVYNSLRPTKTVMQTRIMDVCEPYIFVLPIILSKCGFWKDRLDIDFESSPYIKKGELDLIELEFAEGVPEQIEGDCGMFTVCFAEHFLYQKFEEIPNPFPIIQYRKRLCVFLYIHCRNKQSEGYESDREYRGRFVRHK